MRVEVYAVVTDKRRETYSFHSEGRHGKIVKMVHFNRIAPGVYNLAFGDWEAGLGKLRDDTRTNNGDSVKVLATVAYIVVDFIRHYPRRRVFAQGSTVSRTRLYQRGLNVYCRMAGSGFRLYGRRNGIWRLFRRGVNYEAFLIEKNCRLHH